MKAICCYVIACLFTTRLFAQSDTAGKLPRVATRVTTRIETRPVDTSQVVLDEQGKALPYHEYIKLIGSGDYGIRLNGSPADTATRRFLKKLSVEEKERALLQLRVYNRINSPVLQEGQLLDVQPVVKETGEEALANKVIVLVFWNVQCTPCTENFENINAITGRLKHPENPVILAITKDGGEQAAALLRSKPLHARIISRAGSILNAYRIARYPSYVITGKDHVIRFAVTGQATQTMVAFENALKKVLDENAIVSGLQIDH